jgi:hypothetical protein
MTKIRYWSMDRLALMIVKMLLNKFDCFITFAYVIEKKVANYFRIIIKETGGKQSPFFQWYEFKPKLQLINPSKNKFIIYTQEDVINFYDKWHKSGIADEMINVAFNREFWSENQKNLIKMMNMNRDHGNFLIACVPQFQNLDNQIKNLCKIRITVVRRGLAVIQTPNRTIYGKDKWDATNNERIEREWLKKGSGLPQYSKLNTFRGMIRFRDLTQKEKDIYEKIKVTERNVIKSDLGVTEQTLQNDPLEIIYKRLIEGKVRNGTELDGVAVAMQITSDALKGRIIKKLKQDEKPPQLSHYYWDKKLKQQDVLSIA